MSAVPTTAARLAGEALHMMAAQARPGPADVAALVASAEGRRPPLEGAALILGARLERHADDFGATRALGLVGEALSAVGWGPARPSMPEPGRRFHVRRRRAGVWPNRGELLERG